MKTRHGWLICRTPCDVPVILLAVMIAASLLVSPLPKRSLRAVWPLLLGLILYWVIARWPWTETQLEWAWWGMLLLGTGVALVGFVGMLAKLRPLFPWMQRWLLALQSRLGGLRQRLPDTFHPNVVAGALGLFVPFGVGMVLRSLQDGHRRHWVRTFLAGALTLTTLAVLVLTQSRAGYMGLAAALLVLAALTTPRWLLVAIPLLMGALVGGGMLVGWSNLADALVSSDPAFGLEWRIDVWSRALYAIADFPFTGVGFGCFEPAVALMYQPSIARPGTFPHAHNLFLQVSVDLGIPGLVAYLAILGLWYCLLFASYRTFRREGQRHLALLSAACIASLSGMCAHGLFDAAVWGNKGAFLAWAVLGLSTALYRLSQKKGTTIS